MLRFFVPALLATVALTASGAELGEVSVRSHIGQQLSADIELVDLSAGDLAELQVKLASPNVFQGARVSMNPALSGLNISVFRDGARRVLHLTTLQPVNAELVHIFFELGSGGRQVVRTASLWLTPEPPGRPRPLAAISAPTAAPTQAPVASATPTAASALATAPTRTAAALIAVAPEPAASAAPVASSAVAPVTTAAATSARPRPSAVPAPARPALTSRDEETMKAAAERAFAARASRPSLQPAMQTVSQPSPQPGPKTGSQPAKLAIAPAARPAEACTPAVEDSRAQQCAAMDASNKALTSKLVDLEGKVKRLQTELAAGTAAAAAATTTPAAGVPAAQATTAAAAAAPAASASSSAPSAATPAHSASGSITDARAAQAAAAEPPKPAAKPAPPAKEPAATKSAAVKSPEEKPKKMSRPKLITTIAASALGLLVVIGLAVHFLRKRRAKGGPLKIWQSFRKKDKDEKPTEPTMDEVTETPAVATAQE